MVVSINKVASSIMSQPRSISHVAEPVVSVPKTLTEIDALNFRTYIHAKTFDFKATQEELNALFKFDGDEFFVKTYDFFIKKLGISENLKPPVINQPAHQSVGMTYDFCQNLITRNPNSLEQGKNAIFGQIRHELQHFIQNMNILRTENIGEEAVDFYSELIANQKIMNTDYMVKNIPLEQVDETVQSNFKILKDLLKNNPNGYENELKAGKKLIADDMKIQLQTFRNLVVQEMGLIKADTKSAKRSEKMLGEMLKEKGYWKDDGSMHLGRYSFDIRENDAMLAQGIAQLKLLPPEQKYCYVQLIKQQQGAFEQLSKNDSNNKEVAELLETTEEMYKKFNLKELISYLFD